VVTVNSSIFDACRAALADGLARSFPGVQLEEFGTDTPNPGVRADLATARGMANIHLWRNLSFDIDAIENDTGRQLVHRSIEDATAEQVAALLEELIAALA
jgi:hypothetical protein